MANNETKHTPGPWKCQLDTYSFDERFHISQAEGAPYTPDCSDVAYTISSDAISIQEANARLIAASPDMYTALKPLAAIPYEEFDWRDRGDDYQVMTWNGVSITIGDIKRARAAIAKANQ